MLDLLTQICVVDFFMSLMLTKVNEKKGKTNDIGHVQIRQFCTNFGKKLKAAPGRSRFAAEAKPLCGTGKNPHFFQKFSRNP